MYSACGILVFVQEKKQSLSLHRRSIELEYDKLIKNQKDLKVSLQVATRAS